MRKKRKSTRFLIEVKERPLPIRVIRLAIRYFMSLFLQIKYSMYNKFSKKMGIISIKRKTPIILSLTTFKARINYVHLAIESLLRQKIKPDYIFLWLAKEEFPSMDIPKKLKKLEKRGLVIKFCAKNIKSYKKLIHTLKENPKANIITVDDDVFYPNWFIEDMIEENKRFPNDVLCYNACNIKIKDNKLESYNKWKYDRNTNKGMEVFPIGCSGIFYPSNSINKEVFNNNYLKICPLADDVWFKAMTLLNNKKCKRIKENNLAFIPILNTQKFSLMKENALNKQNDVQIKKVFDKYNIINKLSIEKNEK